jgi:hypothetical protein
MLSFTSFRNLAVAAIVSLPSAMAFMPAAEAGMQNFKLVNRTRFAIERVNISPSQHDGWGPDRLGRNQVIRPGDVHNFTFTGFDECFFDIKVVFEDGDKSEKRNVNLCEVRVFNVNE